MEKADGVAQLNQPQKNRRSELKTPILKN